jgi:hypothetical protein
VVSALRQFWSELRRDEFRPLGGSRRRVAVAVGLCVVLVAAACASDTESAGDVVPCGDAMVEPADTGHAGHGQGLAAVECSLGSDGRWRRIQGDVVEVSDYRPGTQPSAEQLRAAEDFIAEVRAFTSQVSTYVDGLELGYVYDDVFFSHMVHREWLDDGVTLDPRRPEFLMVDDSTGQFLGVMFVAPHDVAGPQFGGPATVWHYHFGPTFDQMCWVGDSLEPRKPDAETGVCAEGEPRSRTPEMLHLWLTGDNGASFQT